VSTLYCSDTSTFIAPLHAFYTSMATILPTDVTVQVETTGDTIDATSDALVGGWSETPVSAISGAISTGYAAPVGVSALWETGTIINSHHLRGRTYFVPCAGSLFDTSGKPDPSVAVTIQGFIDAFVAAAGPNFVVHSRKTLAHAGGFSAVTSGLLSPKASVLRSRRD
jgi:hypothetical protein